MPKLIPIGLGLGLLLAIPAILNLLQQVITLGLVLGAAVLIWNIKNLFTSTALLLPTAKVIPLAAAFRLLHTPLSSRLGTKEWTPRLIINLKASFPVALAKHFRATLRLPPRTNYTIPQALLLKHLKQGRVNLNLNLVLNVGYLLFLPAKSLKLPVPIPQILPKLTPLIRPINALLGQHRTLLGALIFLIMAPRMTSTLPDSEREALSFPPNPHAFRWVVAPHLIKRTAPLVLTQALPQGKDNLILLNAILLNIMGLQFLKATAVAQVPKVLPAVVRPTLNAVGNLVLVGTLTVPNAQLLSRLLKIILIFLPKASP